MIQFEASEECHFDVDKWSDASRYILCRVRNGIHIPLHAVSEGVNKLREWMNDPNTYFFFFRGRSTLSDASDPSDRTRFRGVDCLTSPLLNGRLLVVCSSSEDCSVDRVSSPALLDADSEGEWSELDLL